MPIDGLLHRAGRDGARRRRAGDERAHPARVAGTACRVREAGALGRRLRARVRRGRSARRRRRSLARRPRRARRDRADPLARARDRARARGTRGDGGGAAPRARPRARPRGSSARAQRAGSSTPRSASRHAYPAASPRRHDDEHHRRRRGDRADVDRRARRAARAGAAREPRQPSRCRARACGGRRGVGPARRTRIFRGRALRSTSGSANLFARSALGTGAPELVVYGHLDTSLTGDAAHDLGVTGLTTNCAGAAVRSVDADAAWVRRGRRKGAVGRGTRRVRRRSRGSPRAGDAASPHAAARRRRDAPRRAGRDRPRHSGAASSTRSRPDGNPTRS